MKPILYIGILCFIISWCFLTFNIPLFMMLLLTSISCIFISKSELLELIAKATLKEKEELKEEIEQLIEDKEKTQNEIETLLEEKSKIVGFSTENLESFTIAYIENKNNEIAELKTQINTLKSDIDKIQLKKTEKEKELQLLIENNEKDYKLLQLENEKDFEKIKSEQTQKIIQLQATVKQLEQEKQTIKEYIEQDNLICRALADHKQQYKDLLEDEKRITARLQKLEINHSEFNNLLDEFKKYNNINIIDRLDGFQFESFISLLFNILGYESQTTQNTGDFGIDVIAEKDGVRYGIQCKLWQADVGNKAIQEAYSGKDYYECHVAIVITNSHFTGNAYTQANRSKVVLWDRDKLISMIDYVNLLYDKQLESL